VRRSERRRPFLARLDRERERGGEREDVSRRGFGEGGKGGKKKKGKKKEGKKKKIIGNRLSMFKNYDS
jgi:hypothetical protein